MFSASFGYAIGNIHGAAIGLACTTGFLCAFDLVDTIRNR